ncbi:hypothetical protein ACN47E_009215 [Coniothyrium glycines]
MVAQRRYSVTGQTPPEDAEAMARSPKLQPLDTTAPGASCGLCESSIDSGKLGPASDDGGAEPVRGRTMAHAGTVVRTSSKRSATQLPSPSSPSHELPPKIARRRIGCHVDADVDTDTDSDVTDVFRDPCEPDDDDDGDLRSESQATSVPSTPGYSRPLTTATLPDTASLEQLQLCAGDMTDDECMEDFALSVSHSRNHSHDGVRLDDKHDLQASWAAFQKAAAALAAAKVLHVPQSDTPPSSNSLNPLTFLTLPPEIRHQIYRNCENLVLHKPLVYCISTFDGEKQHPLGSVSRLVRSEALAIFYSYNLWVIKVEFKMMYDAFQDWIIRLGDGAGLLRLISFSVRGSLFKPTRTHTQSVMFNGALVQIPPGVAVAGNGSEMYSPPDGDASFRIDLSEKFVGGKVDLVRNEGTNEAGSIAQSHLAKLVHGLWTKRHNGTLNGQDWISMVDGFIKFIGGDLTM